MRNTRSLVIIAFPLLAVVLTVAGWVAAPAATEGDAHSQEFDPELAAAYVKAGCWQCHSISTLESQFAEAFGPVAASQQPVGPDLAGIGANLHPEWHMAHLWDPQSVVADSRMPARRFLFDGDSRLGPLGVQVVEFLHTLKVPSETRMPWPTAPLAAPLGEPSAGKELFATHCAGCHGTAGRGDGPAARWIRNPRPPANLAAGELLRGRDADAIYTTITNGIPTTAMPSFQHLPAAERADLAAYVTALAGS